MFGLVLLGIGMLLAIPAILVGIRPAHSLDTL